MESFFSIDRRQVGTLSDRYLDVVLGDWAGTLLLLIQAPLIALAVAGVWANPNRDDQNFYFVLCLSAFFLGAINASREIVKERALFLRERMFNLNVPAYLVSKYRVQLILVIIQAMVLAGLTNAFIPLEVNLLLLVLSLMLVALSGTSIGLCVSSLVKSNDKAVAMVPLLVIPQILFSDVVLGADRLHNWTGDVQQLMPVHWGLEILNSLRGNEVEYQPIFTGVITVGLVSAAAYLVSLWALRRARY